MVAAEAGAPFLTARWESLVFLNYACPPRLLEPLVPAELDAWQGETLVSLVGFLFTDTRLKGIAIPWHRTFEEVFITEHYWGYTRQRDGGTIEYRVEHPPWPVWTSAESAFSGPAEPLYGAAFAAVLSRQPQSAFVAVGSQVAVMPGRRIG